MPPLGPVFTPLQPMVLPDVYIRMVNRGGPPLAAVRTGVVAALVRATWGPLGVVTRLDDVPPIADAYGVGGTTDLVTHVLRGGADEVRVIRLGTGGAAAALSLMDMTAGGATIGVALAAKQPGTRGNGFAATVRDSLLDTTKRELLVYEGTTLLQTIPFAKASGSPPAGYEADQLVAAVAASNSNWVTATRGAGANAVLAAVTGAALSAGTDPLITTTDYSTALTLLESESFNVLVTDAEDNAVQTTVAAWVQRVRNLGQRVLYVLGEPTSVALATRLSRASGFNAHYVVDVVNGFTTAAGLTVEGYKVAGRLAGMIAGRPVNKSITNRPVPDAVNLVGPLPRTDLINAVTAGAVPLRLNGFGQVVAARGVTTLVNPGALGLDAGMQKIRRVRERDELQDAIYLNVLSVLDEDVSNDDAGQIAVINQIQQVVNQRIRSGILRPGAKVYLDPQQASSGDNAYFRVDVDDLDSMEKAYITVGVEFAPQ